MSNKNTGMSEMMKKQILLLTLCLLLSAPQVAAQNRKTDTEHEGLIGSVKTIRVEKAKVLNDADASVEKKRVFSQVTTYDLRGNMTEERDSGPAPYHLYSYDDKGDRLEKNARTPITTGPPTTADWGFLSNVSTSLYRWVFKHDTRGNRVEAKIYRRVFGRSDDHRLLSDTQKIIYRYDDKDRRVETASYDSRDRLLQKWIYTYEDSPNPTQRDEYKSDGSLAIKESYSYEYDERGNWIKRVTSKLPSKSGESQLEPVEVTYRTITYH